MTAHPYRCDDPTHHDGCPTCGGAGEIGYCPPRCDGSHVADGYKRCGDCGGTGRIEASS